MGDRLTGHEHTLLEGVGTLGAMAGAWVDGVVYETDFSGAGKPTVVELRRGDTQDADHRLAQWRERLQLSHPNLLQLYAAGRSQLDSMPVLYLVMERPDESLAEILAQRALSHEEAGEILQPILSGLSYLHKQGYTHPRLEPSRVLAVDNTLRLSTDGVERAGTVGVPADDMHALGVLLTEALTGFSAESTFDSSRDVLAGLPEPLNGLIRNCLSRNPASRWTAERALAYVSAQHPPGLDAAPRFTAPVANTPGRKWIYVLAAAILLIAALLFTALRSTNRKAPSPAVAMDGNGSSTPPALSPIKRPEEATTAPPPSLGKETTAHPGRGRAATWVVVVGSYGTRVPAERRAKEVARRWPKFHVELVESASERARVLLIIGKNLSEKDAEKLRKRAVQAGLPRNTYVRKLDTGNG